MANMLSDSSWYKSSGNKVPSDIARDAYDEAINIFKTSLSKDSKKHNIVSQTASINDVLDAVLDAQRHYEDSRKSHAARKWLADFSVRVQFYGNIMDVMIQHHPEYVSLAWGAMKFLFVGVLNHENMVASLAKCLCQIADALPRMHLAALLYPTDRLLHAVAELYAYIIRLLVRAQSWYQENRLRHLIHSITRPDEIRNDDLKLAIQQCSRNIEALAVAGSQAELRDLHLELQGLTLTQQKYTQSLDALRNLIVSRQFTDPIGHINTNVKLTKLQRAAILTNLSGLNIYDYEHNWERSIRLRNHRRSRDRKNLNTFWTDQAFVSWNLCSDSALILVRSSLDLSGSVQDLFIDAIEHLLQSKVSVLWLLKTPDGNSMQELSQVDVLKTLILQALQLGCDSWTEAQLSSVVRRCRTTTSEDDWLTLLGSIVEAIPRLYIVINLDCIHMHRSAQTANIPFHEACNRLLTQLSHHSPMVALKIVLLTARPIARPELYQTATQYTVNASLKVRMSKAKPGRNSHIRSDVRGRDTRMQNLFRAK